MEDIERRRREREQRRKQREEELRKEEEEYQRRRAERMANRAQREAELTKTVASVETSPRPSTTVTSIDIPTEKTSTPPSTETPSPPVTPNSRSARREAGNPDLDNYEIRAQQARLDAIRRRREERKALELQAREAERKREEARRLRKLQENAETDKLIEQMNSKLKATSATEGEVGSVDGAVFARMKEKIDTLEAREKGQKEVQEQLTAEVESLRKQVAELNETLSVYRSPSAKKLAIVKTPVVEDAKLPEVPLPLPKITVGDAVLAMFSDHEYFLCHVSSELDDTFVVKLDNGDESEVSKEKVFPPMPKILECLDDTARKEAKLRETYAEMETAYKNEVAGLTDEVKKLREDYAKMKAVYGVDVRDMLMKRVNKNRPPKKEKKEDEPETTSGGENGDDEDEDEDEIDEQQQFDDDVACNELVRPYSLECDVACYAAKVEEVEENRRGDTRWFTAKEQDADFWKHLSDSVDEITQPNPICHGRRARFFQLYHDGDTDDLEIFQAKTFCAKDLDPERISIIDTFNEIWVYVGGDTSPEDEVDGTNAALGLAERANDGRSPMTPVVVVHQGKEPLRFRACFSDWKLAPPASKKPDEETKAPEEDDSEPTYTYEQLLDRDNLPDFVDLSRLETYLTDDAFEKVFGMRRSKYVSLPEWKQTELRIKTHLF